MGEMEADVAVVEVASKARARGSHAALPHQLVNLMASPNGEAEKWSRASGC